MKTKLIILILGIGIVFSGESAKADESMKLKSMGVAAALALDPLPGDALFYADKPVQGAINLVVGGIGAGFFYTGLVTHLTENCDASSSGEWCGFGSGLSMGFGSIIYFPMLIWDAIGGISGVKAHNDKVRKQTSVWNKFQPQLAVTNKSTFVGMQIRF